MASNASTAFVTGATGTQGTAVARQLHAIGWTVHATARDMEKPIVKELQALGVKFTPGDWADEAALTAAIAGCSHLFLNLMPNITNFSSEVPYAKRILAIAKDAGVRHVVYSSTIAADGLEEREFYVPGTIVAMVTGWKREIEGLVKAAGFESWTILQGAYFMPNFLQPKVSMFKGLVETNTWTSAMTPQTRIPMVDTDDIGKFAAAAFQDPSRFHARKIGLASEFLTPGEVMQQLGEAAGRDMRCKFMTEAEIEQAQKASDPFVPGQLLMRDVDKCVDLDEVRSWGIPLGTFREFLEREKRGVRETYP